MKIRQKTKVWQKGYLKKTFANAKKFEKGLSLGRLRIKVKRSKIMLIRYSGIFWLILHARILYKSEKYIAHQIFTQH